MPVENVDVAVLGGGPAGIAAAIGAARQGARTVLLERAEVLGGNVTLAFVHTICGLFKLDVEQPRHVHHGFPRTFARRLRRLGLAGDPVRQGRVHILPIYPNRMAPVLRELCEAQPNLEVRAGTACSGVSLREDPPRVRYEGERKGQFAAKRIVDATGAAVTAPGERWVRVTDREKLQVPSYIVRLEGVPPDATEGYGRLRLTRALGRGVRDRTLPEGCESVLLRPADTPGSAFLTLNLPDPWEEPGDSTHPSRLRSLTRMARERVGAIVRFLRDHREGFEDCAVAEWPRRLGVREQGTLKTVLTLTAGDLLEARRFDDWVARSAWPIELWESYERADFTYPEGVGYIPLRALVADFDARVGVAGRCAGATHRAMGALRVIGTALATGEAVGVVAARAVAQSISLDEVPAEDVRAAIRNRRREQS